MWTNTFNAVIFNDVPKLTLFLLAARGVQFVCGLSDTVANIGERAELSCKLSSDTSEGRWYKNEKLVSTED